MNLFPIVLDVIFAIVLIVFLALGAKRGLILAIFSFLAIFVAFAGASVVAKNLQPALSEKLEPRIQTIIEQKLETEAENQQNSVSVTTDDDDTSLPSSILDVIHSLGLYESVVGTLKDAALDSLHNAVSTVANAVASEVAASLAYLILFVIFFILILIVWKLIGRLLDLISKLPVLNEINHGGGAIVGLIQGALVLTLAAYVIRFLGKVIPESVVDQTYIVKFFTNINLVGLISQL